MAERCVILVSGEVQGVNFRSMVKVRALSFGIVGTVQNLPDRTVRIVAEAPRERLEELLRWLHGRPAGLKIETIQDHWSPARQEFTRFSILN